MAEAIARSSPWVAVATRRPEQKRKHGGFPIGMDEDWPMNYSVLKRS